MDNFDKTFDQTFPGYERIGRGSFQERNGEIDRYLVMYKDENGKIQSGFFSYEQDFEEIKKI